MTADHRRNAGVIVGIAVLWLCAAMIPCSAQEAGLEPIYAPGQEWPHSVHGRNAGVWNDTLFLALLAAWAVMPAAVGLRVTCRGVAVIVGRGASVWLWSPRAFPQNVCAMKWIIVLAVLACVPARGQSLDLWPDVPPCADTLTYRMIAMPKCNMTLLVGGPRVITTQADLRALLLRHSPPCDTAEMPRINFEQYTLIGRWITLGNCPMGSWFSVYVCRDSSARLYRHTVLQPESPCRGLSSVMSWMLVPKLPEGYSVVFEARKR